MDYKDVFLKSLSDDQLGLFYAHEQDNNLEDLLQDHISCKQFALFTEWKKHELMMAKEKKSSGANFDSSALISQLDNVAAILTSLNKRMDGIESRLILSEQNAVEKIASVEENLNNRIVELTEATESNFLALEEHSKETLKELDEFREKQTTIISSLATQVDINSAQTAIVQTEVNEMLSEITKKVEHIDEETVNISLSSLLSFDGENVFQNWLFELQKKTKDTEVTEKKKEELGSRENLEIILTMMKNFEENEAIQRVIINTLNILAGVAHATRMSIIHDGILEYLKELFVKYWPERDTKEEIIRGILLVFNNLSGYIVARKYLVKDLFSEVFLLQFSAPEFSCLNIVAGNLVNNLLDIDDTDWKIKQTKKEFADILNKNMNV